MKKKMKMIPTFDFPLKDFFIKVFAEKVHLVGGTVRDSILYGRIDENRDIDLTTSASVRWVGAAIILGVAALYAFFW